MILKYLKYNLKANITHNGLQTWVQQSSVKAIIHHAGSIMRCGRCATENYAGGMAKVSVTNFSIAAGHLPQLQAQSSLLFLGLGIHYCALRVCQI